MICQAIDKDTGRFCQRKAAYRYYDDDGFVDVCCRKCKENNDPGFRFKVIKKRAAKHKNKK